jgi:hypothetical protein
MGCAYSSRRPRESGREESHAKAQRREVKTVLLRAFAPLREKFESVGYRQAMTSVFQLEPHPGSVPSTAQWIEVSVWHDDDGWHFRYLVEVAGYLVLPDPQEPGRADDLWRTTCFEAFIGNESGSYTELNFSPSRQWAAYSFDAPRRGMRNGAAECEVWLEGGEDWIAVEAAVHGELPDGAKLGLSAVLEEADGAKSYWALAHCGDKPDFHDPDCFVARLP